MNLLYKDRILPLPPVPPKSFVWKKRSYYPKGTTFLEPLWIYIIKILLRINYDLSLIYYAIINQNINKYCYRKKIVFALLAPEDDNSHEPMSEWEDDDGGITRLLSLVIVQSLIERVPGNRINGYFEVVIPNYNDREFKSHFRLGRKSLVVALRQKTRRTNG